MSINIHLVQSKIPRTHPAQNRSHLSKLIHKHEISPGGLFLLPELFSTGTVKDVRGFEEKGGANILKEDKLFLKNYAIDSACYILGSSLALHKGKLENLSLFYNPRGRLLATYRKIHPFSMGGEGKHFRPGNKTSRNIIEGIKIQNTICYDLRFPEIYASGFRRGVHLFTVQANWPASRQYHWDALLQARAIETQSYVVGVNITGTLNNVVYAGGSKVFSPTGKLILNAGKSEGVYSLLVDEKQCINWRNKFQVLVDKRSWNFYKEN